MHEWWKKDDSRITNPTERMRLLEWLAGDSHDSCYDVLIT